MTDRRRETRPDARRLLTDWLNPFSLFTVLYALVAFVYAPAGAAILYVALELVAAGFVVGYVLLMRRRARVSDFWISARAQRLVPALFLLGAFVALLASLHLLSAPDPVVRLTLSMGLASAGVAAITPLWKASAHCAVAGHAAVAGLLLLGAGGLPFALALPAVLYARIAPAAHTPAQALAGAAVGGLLAAVVL